MNRLILALLSVTAAIGLIGCGNDGTQGTRPSGTTVTPAPGGRGGMMGSGMRGHGMMMGSAMQRHRQAMMGGLPATYRGLSNPLPSNSRVLSDGEALYRTNCAACHGNTGDGNGPAAAGMSPPPANLRGLSTRPMASDGYLMWAISEGGAGLGTAMPAFKGTLSQTERWKIIRYLEVLP
jgi:mono/diheme cytochrome c family protein